jgi:RNA polymerase sigma factor (sigma-70 family)
MPKPNSATVHDEQSVKTRQDLVLEVMPHIKASAAHIMRQNPWCRVGVSLEDLEQEGALGALQAAANYDSTQGIKFWSFAWRRIEGRMIDTFQDRNYDYMRCQALKGVLPDFEENYARTAADPRSMAALNQAEHDSNFRVVHQVLRKLACRNQEILQQYFFEDKPHTTIAQTAGIGKSQVHSLFHESLQDIRTYLGHRGVTAATFFTKGSTETASCQ